MKLSAVSCRTTSKGHGRLGPDDGVYTLNYILSELLISWHLLQAERGGRDVETVTGQRPITEYLVEVFMFSHCINI